MKKTMLFACLFISVLAVGCAMNEKMPKTPSIIQQASKNTDKLLNAGFMDVENAFGTPYSSVYYINANNLRGKNINNLTMEDLRNNITVLSTYENDQNKDSYLHVYYENGKVKETLVGDYNLYNSDKFPSKANLSGATYKIEFFKNKGVLCYDDFSLKYAKDNFLGKTINDFNTSYHVKSANFVASTANGNNKIYFYPVVPHNVHPSKEHKYPNYGSNNDAKLGTVNPTNNNISNTSKANSKDLANYAKSAILIHTKDDKIKSIDIADSKFVYSIIDKSLKNK
ncbi:hypothetical protein [Romboutsia sp.]|uniref:hypothetical protein n=1 Tax=Romboutsia sp. TaxID=1965302 RepID=UPI003F34FE0E